MVEDPHNCPHCGIRLEPYESFCPECGTKVVSEEITVVKRPKGTKRKKRAAPKPKSGLEDEPEADPKTILVIDDEMNTLLVVQKILEKSGYSVDLAVSGEQGIAKLRDIQPDLVILDVKMPGMSGIEVCEKLREKPMGRNLKVIFLTVVEYTPEMRKELESLNVSDYIVKPFKIRDLLRSIRDAIP